MSLADELGQTPVHCAALEDRLSLLHRFPDLLLSMNERSKLLQTPLHLALHRGHLDFAKVLLQRGADPSLVDGYGNNALDWSLETKPYSTKFRNTTLQLSPHLNILDMPLFVNPSFKYQRH